MIKFSSIYTDKKNFRALGKFSYQVESSYSIGTVGYQDVDCHAIDHTYVRYTMLSWIIYMSGIPCCHKSYICQVYLDAIDYTYVRYTMLS